MQKRVSVQHLHGQMKLDLLLHKNFPWQKQISLTEKTKCHRNKFLSEKKFLYNNNKKVPITETNFCLRFYKRDALLAQTQKLSAINKSFCQRKKLLSQKQVEMNLIYKDMVHVKKYIENPFDIHYKIFSLLLQIRQNFCLPFFYYFNIQKE